ncbi:MAG: DNA polymerase III subunit beta [Anaerolineaceae bacterium]|nr:DNA polymerase III subunit beta [Anaerolineaceae bacterium]
MRVSVRQENLAKGLSIVGRAVENRPTLPVLSNVLLNAEDARLKLAAMDMSLGMSITCWIGAKVDEPGAITLPKNTLADLVNNLSPERVDLTLDKTHQTVNVRCGTTVSNIKGIDSSEFPLLPEDGGGDVIVSGRTLKDMINQTVFATAKEDNRPILTGIYTELNGNTLTMAAADGYRLAVRTSEIEANFPESFSMVIPGRALAEVARIISEEDDEIGITLPGDRDMVLFHLKNVLVSSQLLEGRFPDFGGVIPKNYITQTVVYTSDLLRACKRAAIFARDSAGSAQILIKPARSAGEPGEVVIAGRSNERGDNTGMVDASVEGEGLDVSLNVEYLIDVLNVIPDERVILQSNGATSPSVLRPENRDDFIHVIMPMTRPN